MKGLLFLLLALFILNFQTRLFSQCNNFSNSITVPAAGTVNNCNGVPASPTATICADFDVTFSNGNASFYWGYTITTNGVPTTTTNGPINSNNSGSFPNIVCVSFPCGSSITFFVTAYSNPNGGGSQCNGANATVVTTPYTATLPITLEKFNCSSEKSGVRLDWSTATEINNAYFQIEKSNDGINWYDIAKIDGQGNSLHTVSYTYFDSSVSSKPVYYRLKQVDFDGKFEYSKIITAFVRNEKIKVTAFSNLIQVNSNEDNTLETAKIFSLDGKLVESYSFSNSDTDINILLENLKSDIYIVEIISKYDRVVNKVVKI